MRVSLHYILKQAVKTAVVVGVLLTPAKLSSIKILYKPTYPICIMQVGDIKYLLLEPRGEVVKSG